MILSHVKYEASCIFLCLHFSFTISRKAFPSTGIRKPTEHVSGDCGLLLNSPGCDLYHTVFVLLLGTCTDRPETGRKQTCVSFTTQLFTGPHICFLFAYLSDKCSINLSDKCEIHQTMETAEEGEEV